MAFDKSKFMARFVVEAKEHVNSLNQGFLALEKNPEDEETLNAVFRSAHTIKGSARMMKLPAIGETAHRLEDVMDALRRKRICITEALSDLIYEAVDAIESLLDQAAAGAEMSAPADLCDKLEAAARGEDATGGGEETPAGPDPPASPAPKAAPEQTPDPPTGTAPSGKKATCGEPRKKLPDTIRISADKLDELIKLMGEIISSHSRSKQRLADLAEIEKSAARHLDILASLETGNANNGAREKITASATRLQTRLKQITAAMKEDLNIEGILTADLQDRSLRMRMLPLSTLFESFGRLVRTESRAAGKTADVEVIGGDTEVDRKILEKLNDPLVHMVRNCLEHGIEPPAVRTVSGKPPAGKIRLAAGYEGGNVLITLSDDGAGISVEKVREKALKKRIIREDAAGAMSDDDVVNLIFHPGLSTSDIITDLSGRGVGMDVVKQNIIDDLKGSIQIRNAPGKGAAFHIRAPLTMAIIHVLFISAHGQAFAAPADYIEEIISISPADLIKVTDRNAVRLRERLIPVVELSDVLGLPETVERAADAETLVLIAALGGERLGVAVDALIDEDDMVIKTLPPHMKNVPFVSGCIISGRNEIFNVLHIPKIIEAARESGARERRPARAEPEARTVNILVVDDSVSTREIEKSILESYGYVVTLAGDGREGLETAQSARFDLVVTDVEMPRMDGIELTRALREDAAYGDTPVILITTRDSEEDKKRGIMAGADAYIVKGTFEQDVLLETVRNLVG